MSEWRKPKPENAVIEAVMQMEDTLAAAVLAVQADNNRLRADVEAALAWTDSERGVSCAGRTVDYDGCFVADLAKRVRTALTADAIRRAALASPAEPGATNDTTEA